MGWFMMNKMRLKKWTWVHKVNKLKIKKNKST